MKKENIVFYRIAMLVLLITVVLFCDCFVSERNTVTAQAAVDKNGFDIRDGLLYWYKGTSKKVVIPDTVTVIGEGAFYNQDITSVTIPDTVTEIKPIAFKGCSNLTSITIPESVNSIGMEAFAGCSKLSKVTISGSELSIGEEAFLDCTALTSVTMLDGVLEIGEKAFDGCQNVTELTLSDTITTIGAYAFRRLKMKELTLPGSVTTMGKVAFGGCSELTKLTVSEGATTIGAQAFIRCPKLTEVILPDSLITIDKRAFDSCESLCKIEIPKNVTTIGEYAFYSCSSAVSVTIPRSVTYIGSGAFSRLSEDAVFYVAKGSYAESAIKRLYSYEYEYIDTVNDLTAVSGNRKAELTWDIVPGAECYAVYMKTASGNTVLVDSRVTTNKYTVTGLANGTTVGFVIKSYVDKQWGGWSSTVWVTPQAIAEAPTNLKTVIGNGQVIVSWDAVPGAQVYALFLKRANGEVVLVHNRVNETTYTITGLENGTTVGFVVKSYVDKQWSGWSSTVWATPQAIATAPTNLKAVAGNGQVIVSWDAVPGAQLYALFLKRANGEVVLVHNRISGTSYTVTGCQNGVSVGFVVKSYVNKQWSDWSTTAWAMPKAY